MVVRRAESPPGHGPEDGGLPSAVDGGVSGATVIDGRLPHAVLLALPTEGTGTMVSRRSPLMRSRQYASAR